MDIQYFQTTFKQLRGEDLKAAKTEEADSVEGTLIKGFASTPAKDRHNDIVEPEAFKKSIRSEYKRNPIILFAHNTSRPIGKATHMEVSEKGLYIEALIVDKEVEPLIKAGILKMFSIGYIPKAVSFEDSEGNTLDPKDPTDREKIWMGKDVVRKITKLELVENSIVAIPANGEAEFGLAGSVKSFFDKELKKTEKSIILDLENNQKSMEKSENLLDTKEEEVEKVEETEEVEKVEEEVVEETEKVEEVEEAVEGEETKPAEGETDSSEEGDETPAVEEAPKEEEEKAFAEFSAEKKTMLEHMITPEGAIKALDSLILKNAEIVDLKAELATAKALLKGTPAKKAEANVESKKEAKGFDGLKSKGFKEALMKGNL